MDLAGASVFVDFDGTIATQDTGLVLLERLAPPQWRELEDRYVAGLIGSRACMVGQWALLPRDRALLEAVAREVPLDPGLPDLVELLRDAGAEVTVVSDGFGFRASEVAAAFGLPVLTNEVDWDRFELVLPRTGACACAACGTCKQAPVREASARGRTTVLIGDGTSDARAAELADVVFAKDHLAEWCDRHARRYHRFESLGDVVARLRAGAG